MSDLSISASDAEASAVVSQQQVPRDVEEKEEVKSDVEVVASDTTIGDMGTIHTKITSAPENLTGTTEDKESDNENDDENENEEGVENDQTAQDNDDNEDNEDGEKKDTSSSQPANLSSQHPHSMSKNAKKHAKKKAKKRLEAAAHMSSPIETPTAASPTPTVAPATSQKTTDFRDRRLSEQEMTLLWKLEALERGNVALTDKDEELIQLNAKSLLDQQLKTVFAEKDDHKRELLLLALINESSLNSMRSLRKVFRWEEKYERSVKMREHFHGIALEATNKVDDILTASQALEAKNRESIALERQRFDSVIGDIQTKMAKFGDLEAQLAAENKDLRTKLISLLDEDKAKTDQIRLLKQQAALEKKVLERDLLSKTMLCDEKTRICDLSNKQVTQLTELKVLYEKNIEQHKKRNDELQKAILNNKKTNDKYADALNKMKKDVDDVITMNKNLRAELNDEKERGTQRLKKALDGERKIGELTTKLELMSKKCNTAQDTCSKLEQKLKEHNISIPTDLPPTV